MHQDIEQDIDRAFGFLIIDISRMLRATFDRRVRAMGLTRAQWSVLSHLYRMDGLTQSELAKLLEVERPTIGRLLDRMETAGWVERRADSKDRRVKRVHLTKKAWPAAKELRTIALELREDVLVGIDGEARELLISQLVKVKANILKISPTDPSGGPTTAQKSR